MMYGESYFITLTDKISYRKWKVLIQSFAIQQDSLDILHGKISKDNAIELMDKDHLREENQMGKYPNKSTELQTNALDVFYKKDLQLKKVLIATITSNIFNAINITSESEFSAAELFEEICRLFEPRENLQELHNKFLNSKLEYGEDAYAFYRDLEKLFEKLEKSGVMIGEQAQKAKAIQSLPGQLRMMKLRLSKETSLEVSFDDLVKDIIDKYKNYVAVFPPDRATSINQNTQLVGVKNQDYNGNTSLKDETGVISMLRASTPSSTRTL